MERVGAALGGSPPTRAEAQEQAAEKPASPLQNLAEEAGQYVASLPEFPREETEGERWRVAFVRQQARRALEDMETFRGCQQALKEARVASLPSLVEQARRCIDCALRMLRECCPSPPRPSPLAEPAGV